LETRGVPCFLIWNFGGQSMFQKVAFKTWKYGLI